MNVYYVESARYFYITYASSRLWKVEFEDDIDVQTSLQAFMDFKSPFQGQELV
jgi:hypothetical protein